MAQSIYSPLPRGNIRLLQLLPDRDGDGIIQCRLLSFPLHQSDKGSPPYDVLSYEWGSHTIPRSISIEGHVIAALYNLYAALSHLRKHFFERLIWADAICINQQDLDEKSEQIKLSSKIYKSAQRTICWVPSVLPRSALRLLSHLQQFHHWVTHGGSLVSESDLYHSDYKISASVLESFRRDKRFLDAEAWQSLSAFLDDRYFQRLWIMHDWICSELPVLCCPSNEFLFNELSWEEFCNALEVALLCSANNFPLSTGLLPVVTAGHLRKRRNFNSWQALSYKDYVLMQQTSTSVATSERDYVFAILSLMQGTGLREGIRFSPNYSLEVSEIYTQAARELGLLSLSLTKSPVSPTPDLPSWVPDWRRHLGRFLLNHTRSDFSASLRPHPLNFHQDTANSVLRCGCLQVDKILKVSSYLPPRRHYDHYNVDGANIIILDEWYEFAADHIKRFGRTAVSKVEVLLQYANTIQARGCNSVWESNTSMDDNHLVKKTRDFIRFLNAENAEATIDIQLFYAACFPSHDRRFGVTEREYFCLVPKETKKGDLVCIPHGNMVPIIFRGEGLRFKNLGEAYVNGLMTGEGEVLEDVKDLVLEVV